MHAKHPYDVVATLPMALLKEFALPLRLLLCFPNLVVISLSIPIPILEEFPMMHDPGSEGDLGEITRLAVSQPQDFGDRPFWQSCLVLDPSETLFGNRSDQLAID
jgi:hypothetical protein